MELDTKLKRALYHSPLQHTGGKTALIVILIGLFIYALPSFQKYYFAQSVPMLAGVVVSSILYLPTVLVLYFLDRRERESKLLFWGTTLSVIFFFGPVASRTNNLFREYSGLSDWQFVGFVEETIKILPLVLLIVFVRPAVNGTRDGLIYGALGGLGFAILEAAAYFALLDYPKVGWPALFTNTVGRATFLGTDIHILFAATIGAAIGYGVSTKVRWKGILAIVAVFLLVALTHNQQDHVVGKMITVVGAAGSGMIISTLLGIPMEQLDQMQGPVNYLVVSLGSTINMLVINVINLVILFVAVWKSGDTERHAVRDQLKDEPAAVITPDEYAGVEAERRLHLRSLPGYSSQVGRTIRNLQNELAFRKDFVLQQGGSLENDPPAAAIRQSIEAERVKAASARNDLSYSTGRS